MTALFVVAILAGLGLLHGLWALRGPVDSDRIIPRRTRVDPSSGERLHVAAFVPSPGATGLVAAALIGAAALVAMRAGWLGDAASSHGMVRAAVVGIAVVFLARAVGDFELVGFFKARNGSAFARWDTWLYSPLCVVLAAATASVAWR